MCTIDWKVLWQHSIIIQLWFLFAIAATMWPKILWSRIGVFMSLWLCIFHFILKCINILWNWKLVLKIDFIFRQPLCGTGVVSDIWDQCDTRRHSTTTWTEFCHFLTPPHPLRGQFLYPERGQKQTFFDPLLPLSCPRSY